MKKSLLVTFVAMLFVVGIAQPAWANSRGAVIWSWSHGGDTAYCTVYLNQHKIGGAIQAVIDCDEDVGTTTFDIKFDYVKLWNQDNGNLMQVNTVDTTRVNLDGFQRSTDSNGCAHDMYATARFKVFHVGDTHTPDYQIVQSYTVPDSAWNNQLC